MDFEPLFNELLKTHSLDDIGEMFAKQFNTIKQKQENEEQSIDRLSTILYDIIDFLSDYYPKVITLLFHNEAYNCDNIAKKLIKSFNELYDNIDYLEELVELMQQPKIKSKNSNSFTDLVNEFLK